MEFSKRMKLFGDEIFAALNDKKGGSGGPGPHDL